MKLDGRRLLVTGGARGMGLLIAREAAARGASAALWDRDAEALEAAAGSFPPAADGAAPSVWRQVVDVSDRGQVETAAAALRSGFGDPDLLVNNAGVVSGKAFPDLTPEEVERTLSVNAAALFWLTRAFLPSMIRRGEGHLVTMASAGGLIGAPGLSDYCASKFAAIGFHESLRAELRRTAPGVRTTLVCPFFVDTGMFAGVRTRFPRLLPILRPETVAAATIRAIERDRTMVVLPRFVHSLKLLRLLPAGWIDPLAAFFGIHAAMDTFEGRRSESGQGRPRRPA